jgi:uncharacterized protein involved in response to NO
MRGALWSSGFRPFFLLGAAYGPALILLWYAERAGWAPAGPGGPLGHGHELVFGFAVAIVCGVLLTALPSWAGARELRGVPLALLAAIWLAGRAAWWAGERLPAAAAAIADGALVPAMLAALAPALAGARRRLFAWTLPPLLALALANGLFHLARAEELDDAMRWSLRLGLHALAFLYSLYGGLLTPAFTRSYLRARGEPAAAIHVPLEYATAAAMLAFAVADLAGAPDAWIAAAAAAAAAVHAVRFARWRGWRTASEPLLWTLHLGYAWLIAALALRALAALTPAVPGEAWIHAFTVGALGLTMAGLMTRVALRHTGRPLAAAPAMRAAFFAVLAAALARLAWSVHGLAEWVLAASAMLWAGAFLAYLAVHGPMLAAPSLPRR